MTEAQKNAAPALDALIAALAERSGFDARAIRPSQVERSLSELARQGVAVQPLLELFQQGDAAAEERLLRAVSIAETYFFRHYEQFEFLREQAARWGRYRAGQPFVALSAGCATGEEAWSLAAVLSESLNLESPEGLQVWGMDMLERNLEIARQAVYGKWSFRELAAVPASLAGAQADGQSWRVADRLRPYVQFKRHNLLDRLPLQNVDLILCRNVLVYFRPEAARSAMARMVEALRPGGLFVAGHTDLDFVPDGLQALEPYDLRVFVKKDARPALPALEARFKGLPSESVGTSGQSFPQPLNKPRREVHSHVTALQMMESGDEIGAQQQLELLCGASPDYLPGWFELAASRQRLGQRQGARVAFRMVLELALERDKNQEVEGPELAPAGFYVASAQAYLDREGA